MGPGGRGPRERGVRRWEAWRPWARHPACSPRSSPIPPSCALRAGAGGAPWRSYRTSSGTARSGSSVQHTGHTHRWARSNPGGGGGAKNGSINLHLVLFLLEILAPPHVFWSGGPPPGGRLRGLGGQPSPYDTYEYKKRSKPNSWCNPRRKEKR